MKRPALKVTVLLLLLTALLLFCGCGREEAEESTLTRYEATFLTLFDTVTTVVGYAESEDAFAQTAQQIHDELLRYHRLYDIYNDYSGIVNLKTVNDRAPLEAVKVEREIIDLLLFCREMEQATGGRVNAGLGSVLSLWHDARTAAMNGEGALPDPTALSAAAGHTDLSHLVIDEAASTVRFTDPLLRLDVGAVAKGYAVEQVCSRAPAGLLISVGGNVCATGPKPDGTPWVVGVRDPDGDGNLHTLYAEGGSIVTSGDYQRYFTVDGESYHHIIDPDTLMPGDKWRAVTVLCEDSGVADALSTALFLLPREEGEALLNAFDAHAMWLGKDGSEYFSPGFSRRLRT